MARNNQVMVKGDITGDIYYDVFTQAETPLAFLRLYLMVNSTPDAKELRGLRVVFYGFLAELAEAHVQKGSRILVNGHIQMRRAPNGNPTFEIVAEDVEFLRHINWERGNKRYTEMLANGKIPGRAATLASMLVDNAFEFPESSHEP